MSWILASVGALLLFISALLTVAGTAVFSVSAPRIRTLVAEGFRGAEDLAELRGRSAAIITLVHLFTTVLNLVAVGLGVMIGIERAGVDGGLVGLLVATVVVLFFAEILPRGLASRGPVRLALASAGRILALDRMLGFLVRPLSRLEDALAGVAEAGESASEREIREMADLGRAEGIVDAEEELLIERAFKLDELTAFDVMTPRVDIFAWSDDLTLDAIIDDLRSVPHSRVPVYGESTDDITGILYVREAYQTWVSGRRDVKLRALSREPFFVPGSISLARLLRDFQSRRIHMGIVADEYGGTDGLVTLEDVLEELVGEIVDETDPDAEPLLRIGSSAIVAGGSVDLREINEALDVDLPTGDNRSLNGYILDELGYVPPTGAETERDGIAIEILEATETQVLRVRLTRTPADDADD
jgi:putative hemolysin